MPIYTRVQSVLQQSDEILQQLDTYTSVATLARAAMQNPNPQTELAAYQHAQQCVEKILLFYKFSLSLEEIAPQLLQTLVSQSGDTTSTSTGTTRQSFQDQQALARQLADLFSFALQFDGKRIMFTYQNDFSMYKRAQPKYAARDRQLQQQSQESGSTSSSAPLILKDDEMSSLAMFSAVNTPMLNAISRATSLALERDEHATKALEVMANSCCAMLKQKRFESESTRLYTARAMVGSCIVFDHVDPLGLFNRRCSIHLKSIIRLIKEFEPPHNNTLLNALHYSTKHFNEADQSTQAMFE